MLIYSWIMNGQKKQYVGCETTSWTRVQSFALVRNTIRKCWHLVDLATGAMMATSGSRTEIRRLAKVAHPISREQHALATIWSKGVEILMDSDFFGRFTNYELRDGV